MLSPITLSAIKASMTSGPVPATVPVGGMSIPPEVQRILQQGMQSILERGANDGQAQFEYV
jgi:hypothetical protein